MTRATAREARLAVVEAFREGRLPPRQVACLEAIQAYQRANAGRPPALRDLCEALGVTSKFTVIGHLERLQAKGFIEREPHGQRGIRVLKNADGSPACCPACGRVA